jgi:hypothetical protein
MFMFSQSYIEKMLQLCTDGGKGRLIMFVKKGMDISNQEVA